MKVTKSMIKILRASLMSGAAIAVMSGAAFAADLGGSSLKDEPVAKSDFTIAVTGGATTDYMFRGISQNDNDPSVNASVTLGYKMFYLGFAAEAVDPHTTCNGCSMEADVVGGIKTSYRGIDLDLGFIYYGYTNQDNNGLPAADFFELKASASTKIISDLTVTGTVFWSPDYTGETGNTWTFEGSLSKPLPIWGLVASGTLGYVTNEGKNGGLAAVLDSDDYTYWNVGLSKTFREKYTFDVRYWGTDVDNAAAASYLAGDRIVGSFTFSY